MLNQAFTDLGWFEDIPGRITPKFVPDQLDRQVEIKLNTIALADTNLNDDEAEMGSNLSDIRWTFYVDIFAEDKATGIHIVNDVRDIMKGKMPSIGRDMQRLDVYDYTLATPVKIFSCDVEKVMVDRGQDFSKPWLHHWYMCRFDIVDAY